MAKKMEKLAEEIHELSDIEKLWLVGMILKDLDKPDPAIDRVWAAEAQALGSLQVRSSPNGFLNPSWQNTAACEGTLCYPSIVGHSILPVKKLF